MSEPSDFWSRRKARVAREALESEAPEPIAPDERTEEEVLEELGLPDPDTLKAGDNFMAFMKEAVPSAIRKRALRQLWRSNPVLANVDGLVDYGEDFTGGTASGEKIKTAYQVGKGLLRHVEAPDMQDPPPPVEEPEEESAEPEEPEQIAQTEAARAPSTATPSLRMRFRYDEISPEDT